MITPLHVLQVEDSESDAALIMRMLEKAGLSIKAQRVEDGVQMKEALLKQRWDVIIADYYLPQFDAPSALRVLQETGLDIPLIVVSGSMGEDVAVEMMRSGVQDYLLKSNLARLAPAVEREVGAAQRRATRRRMEQELAASQDRLARAIQATRLGTFEVDLLSGTVDWSDIQRQHFGVPNGDAVSLETFQRALHPDDRDRVNALVERACRPFATCGYEAEYRVIGIDDGVERWLSAKGSVTFDSDGHALRLVGVNQDITARKRLEEEFRQSQKLEGIGRLAGGVAHDFNNLLTVISGYARMLLQELEQPDCPAESLVDPITEISRAADRATDLTRQLLAFSRRQVTKPQVFSLNELVHNFEKMLHRLITEDIQLTLTLNAPASRIRADPGQIEQILMNLAVNAKDAMPNGGRLTIETSSVVVDERLAHGHLTLRPGPYVALSVSDSGVGMSAETKARVFEPFFTTKEPGKGTGLGLSTVYGIVKQNEGEIWIYSEPGQGSIFKIFFPASQAEATGASARAVESLSQGSETILLVEDEASVRKFVSKALRLRGYTVLEADNGHAALELAKEHSGPIHLLITDAVMPSMGGAELARQFHLEYPETPVLCMSGYSEDAWPGVERDVSYIGKPFQAATLLARVRNLLDSTTTLDS